MPKIKKGIHKKLNNREKEVPVVKEDLIQITIFTYHNTKQKRL